MSPRWKQRQPVSNWGEFGPDDQRGRMNLVTPEKVLQGVAEVKTGLRFCLSLPLDYPGGNTVSPRRMPPRRFATARSGGPNFNFLFSGVDARHTDVVCDDGVLLWLQYSTQWDALAHQGAEFDADGDGVAEPVYYNGFRAGTDVIGPRPDAKADGSGSVSFGRHLGLEHMAAHGVQGRGVLVDVAHHLDAEWQPVNLKLLKEIMAADNVVVEPGDMLLIHTGFATQVLAWDRNPDPDKIRAMYPYLDGEDESLLEWIAESRISALIADNYAVEGWPAPSREPHTLLPIHHLCLFKLGVPLGELWYLHELAAWLRGHQRSRFLLTAPPLRLPGAMGSPLTPVATV